VTGDTVFQELRPLMFTLAYRMLGSVTEAEDIVQEAFLRYHRAGLDGVEIQTPKAYLATVTTRLAIDELRSARARRESYVGPWLPEPIVTSEADDPARSAEIRDELSMALLVVLETLGPVERAVYLLHDVFDYGYADVAKIVDRTEDNCRQLAVRARRHIEERRPRFPVDRAQHTELARSFLAACACGDAAELAKLLADDVTFVGDGGGKAMAAREPIVGAVRVIRFLLGLLRQAAKQGVSIDAVRVNGQLGIRTRDAAGDLISVIALDIVDGRVATLHSVINPDKLRHLGPVSGAAQR
jgi:RNA polymerase sigma-70 factor (TIGR02957 family)